MANMSMTKNPIPEQEPLVRNKNFDEVALGYTEEIAIDEAKRCLNCRQHPCVSGCPVNVRIPEFIAKVAEGEFEEAYKIITSTNSLPAVCGRVCPQEHQCEGKCVRGIKGESVGIGRLERFVADWHAAHADPNAKVEKPVSNGHRVAVVGSGPAGLTCAGDLARMGYEVTVYELFHKAGGVLVYGIPEFRLPKAIVAREVAALEEMGVKIVTDAVIGRAISIDELLTEEGFEAVFLGSGAGLPRFLGIPGENLLGVYSANEFLTRINLMKAYREDYDTPIKHHKCVAVVGAGNVAMDAARCAKRLGADVTVVYRRGEEEIPARKEEYEHAKEEGINFHLLCNPIEILADDNGWVRGLKCIRMELGEPDEKGRRKPVGTGEFETLAVSAVISAIGQQIDLCGIDAGSKLQLGKRGTVLVDPATYQTAEPDVFAGGDLVTGPKFAIDAIAAGKEAAVSIHRFVHPGQSQLIGRDHRDYKSLDPATVAVPIESFDNTPRQHAHDGSAEEAKKTFHDLRGVFTEEQMKKETERCLGCGAVVLNEDQCIGCGICTTKCKFDAIRLEKVNDTHGREYFRTLLTVAGNTPAAIGRLVRKTRGR